MRRDRAGAISSQLRRILVERLWSKAMVAKTLVKGVEIGPFAGGSLEHLRQWLHSQRGSPFFFIWPVLLF